MLLQQFRLQLRRMRGGSLHTALAEDIERAGLIGAIE
jgi:hypothetical protein